METFPSSCGDAAGQAILVDTTGNIYVTGSYPYFCERGLVYNELLVIKYGPSGNQMWTATYIGGMSSSVHVGGAELDNQGNIYVVADFNVSVLQYVTLKYSSGGGSYEWVAFNPVDCGPDTSHGIAVDSRGSVYVAGQSCYLAPNYAYANSTCGTYKANTNGVWIWTNDFPTAQNLPSASLGMCLDPTGNCFVTGYSPGTNSGNDIVTIKYGPNGNQVWLQRYHGPGNGDDAGNAIAVDNNGNVYVTGYETTAAGGTEMVTIKYSPVTLQRRADGTVLLQAQGSPGESFDFQGSTDLLNWLDLGSMVADSNGVAQFADTNASNYNQRFYVTSPQ